MAREPFFSLDRISEGDPLFWGVLWGLYGFQARNCDFARDILKKMVWQEVVFWGLYGLVGAFRGSYGIYMVKVANRHVNPIEA